MKVCLLLVLFLAVFGYDKITPPGYPRNYTAYTGYLNTSSALRRLHYIYMPSEKGDDNTDPITLWMNGGPGCASKLGFIQEIAPYYLELGKPYSKGDNLTANNYSWTLISNLLFIDSPAGVGFSINNDPDYKYNDENSAKDMLDALLFFFQKDDFKSLKGRPLYIAGQSYAGKYIPDLAVSIMKYNRNSSDNAINLKGILVGNGVMTFQGGSLQKSEIEYMIERDFIDPELEHYWRQSCQNDEESAGCQYFYSRFSDLTGDINPYNVYGDCYIDVTTERSVTQRLLMKRAARYRAKRDEYGDGDCEYDHGLETYFDQNSDIWNSESKVPFKACNDSIFQKYNRTETASMEQYRELLNSGAIKIWLFSGDWDDVVPFRDTVKNLEKLDLKPQSPYHVWKIDGQHAGFYREYPGLMFYIVKGAGHEVPQYQRQRAYEMFRAFLKP